MPSLNVSLQTKNHEFTSDNATVIRGLREEVFQDIMTGLPEVEEAEITFNKLLNPKTIYPHQNKSGSKMRRLRSMLEETKRKRARLEELRDLDTSHALQKFTATKWLFLN